jgi:hypothetical protein
MNANHLVRQISAQQNDDANETFVALLQDRIADSLEVRKVELASGILECDIEENVMEDHRPPHHTHKVVYSVPGEGKEKQFFHVTADDAAHAKEQLMDAQPTAKIHKVERIVHEGAGMDAQRRWVRQVAAVGKANPEGTKRVVHRAELKKVARKYFQRYEPHGAEFVERGARFVKDARKSVKMKRDYPSNKFEETELAEGGPTRKHFRQTADLIKQIEHPDKRKEMAQHHASLFAQQNPRFDKSKFMAAAGVDEATLDEVLSSGAKPVSGSPNSNVLTNIRRATQMLRLKNVNPQMAAAAHRDFGKLVAKNPKAPGYMLLRKLAPNKAAQVQNLTQAGVPLGGSLETNPADFNQALQRIKRFK